MVHPILIGSVDSWNAIIRTKPKGEHLPSVFLEELFGQRGEFPP